MAMILGLKQAQTPQSYHMRRERDIESSEPGDSHINVCVRLRPRTEQEAQQNEEVAWSLSPKGRLVCNQVIEYGELATETTTSYNFDLVAGPDMTTEHLYAVFLARHVFHFTRGINCSVLAYGQTGSGKTFTTLGEGSRLGLAQLCVREVFRHLMNDSSQEVQGLQMSYFEIYNDHIFDLLSSSTTFAGGQSLRVRESPTEGFFVQDLQRVELRDEEQFLELLRVGNKQRHTGSTQFNRNSSRSHAVVSLNLISMPKRSDGRTLGEHRVSVLHLVDLAGSERKSVLLRKSQTSAEVAAGRESGYINKSLYYLSNVIHKLAQRETMARREAKEASSPTPPSSPFQQSPPPRTVFIPYRDSSLTKVLSNSLGGNAQTLIICCISPCAAQTYETVLTLNFASLAKRVRNTVHINHSSLARSPSSRQLYLAGPELASALQIKDSAAAASMSSLCDRILMLMPAAARGQGRALLGQLLQEQHDAEVRAAAEREAQARTRQLSIQQQQERQQQQLQRQLLLLDRETPKKKKHDPVLEASQQDNANLRAVIEQLQGRIEDLTQQLEYAKQLLFYQDSISHTSASAADDNLKLLTGLIEQGAAEYGDAAASSAPTTLDNLQ